MLLPFPGGHIAAGISARLAGSGSVVMCIYVRDSQPVAERSRGVKSETSCVKPGGAGRRAGESAMRVVDFSAEDPTNAEGTEEKARGEEAGD
jgi:hypothetical protein